MAFFDFEGKKAYYEVHGEAEQTLVILNGIMMSCASWKPFIDYLVKHVKVVLIDFFDQGQSEYLDFEYDQSLQVNLVCGLLEALNLTKVTLLGISYGGEIAMKVAVKSPELLDQLVLANTTAYTNKQLKTVGDNWVNAAMTFDGRQFFKATIPPIYSTQFYERHYEWLTAREELFVKAFDQRWYRGFVRLVHSAENHDAREAIRDIALPTLIIGSDEDMVTPTACQIELAESIKGAQYAVIKDCGHASMYEKPHAFFSIVLGFINTGREAFII
jgi:pimeloyl-ACP methyl ester carboxylesterase